VDVVGRLPREALSPDVRASLRDAFRATPGLGRS
jgi:hypothetical protein